MQLEHVKDINLSMIMENTNFGEIKFVIKKQLYSEILNENAKNLASVWQLFKEIGASKHKTMQIPFPLKSMTVSSKIQKTFLMNSIIVL